MVFYLTATLKAHPLRLSWVFIHIFSGSALFNLKVPYSRIYFQCVHQYLGRNTCKDLTQASCSRYLTILTFNHLKLILFYLPVIATIPCVNTIKSTQYLCGKCTSSSYCSECDMILQRWTKYKNPFVQLCILFVMLLNMMEETVCQNAFVDT